MKQGKLKPEMNSVYLQLSNLEMFKSFSKL